MRSLPVTGAVYQSYETESIQEKDTASDKQKGDTHPESSGCVKRIWANTE